ncbi:MAG TPA: Crp/Fnr family transcriptional regulator [Verrucomicrobiae bacterium]|nr:Crp/Fnr family transcriptional regulator [Verrucomicrobiae bacterium]
MISRTGTSNSLLAALPQRERDDLQQRSERVLLALDQVIGEPGKPIRDVYFPMDCFVALMAGVDGHDALAADLVGSEGMVGVPLLLGVERSPLRARVLGAGEALRVAAPEFQHALLASVLLERQFRRYAGVRMEQFARTAACAAFHRVEQRVACWLLMAQDRAHRERFVLTHERLARLLGVRRSGVSTAAGTLQAARLITYTRGHVLVLDRVGLEQAACGCYRSARDLTRFGIAAAPRRDVEIAPPRAPPGTPSDAPRPQLSRGIPHRH